MIDNNPIFYLQHDNIYAVPITHYNMEMAAQVKIAFEALNPDCVAVELAETMQLQLLHAASRLPDISVVSTYDPERHPVYYLSEPCDACFEGLRSALESQKAAFCIDLDINNYPEISEGVPDPYAVTRIGLEAYYTAYRHAVLGKSTPKSQIDQQREMYMAKRLKELSLQYEKVLFVGGMYHVEDILKLVSRDSFPNLQLPGKGAVGGIVLEKMGVGLQVGHVIHRYHREEILMALEHRAQAQTPDPAESVNGYPGCHGPSC